MQLLPSVLYVIHTVRQHMWNNSTVELRTEQMQMAAMVAVFASCAVFALWCRNAMHRPSEGPHSNSVGFLLHNTVAYVTTIAGTIKPFRCAQCGQSQRAQQTAVKDLFCIYLDSSVCTKAGTRAPTNMRL